MKNFGLVLLLLLILGFSKISGQDFEKAEDYKGIDEVNSESGIESPATIEVIYDNYMFQKRGQKLIGGSL